MKMDIHAIFNFSSVAYVSFRHGCFIFIFFDEVCNRHGLHSDMDARRMRAHARMLVNASFVELFLATQSSCVNMSVGGHELV